MNLPQPAGYIDIHTHRGETATDIFTVKNLMADEDTIPGNVSDIAFSFGIHPWFLTENNYEQLIISVRDSVDHPGLVAIGEAGFDKLRGPSPEFRRQDFEEQATG